MLPELRPGPANSLADVGLSVGHHTRTDDGHLTGTTVVLAPPEGAVAGVDVRGGGPGTRETDLLDPVNLVDRVHAVTLSGGSAFGLAAADGVMRGLLEAGRGFPMGGPGEVVPIVPGAVIFDLGRGGRWDATPTAEFGRLALDRALAGGSEELGVVGAGTGAKIAGGLKGGVGTASAVLPGGATVAALLVVNAVGSTVDPRTGELLAAGTLLPEDLTIPGTPPLTGLKTPDAEEVAEARRRAQEVDGPGLPATLATTIGVVATDLALTVPQARRLAMSGHDGLARAIDPIHTMFDGDTLFGLATGTADLTTGADPGADPQAAMLTFYHAQRAAAVVVARAAARATLAATTVTTSAGTWRSYRDAFTTGVRS